MPSTDLHHPWQVTPAQARQIQRRLAPQVVTEDQLSEVERVAGLDVGFTNGRNLTRAAVAVLRFPGLELEEWTSACLKTSFPYIPGLLAFREAPALLEALGKLKRLPDLLLCDGQGIAHPHRLGIASHIGLASGLPTIGVAKKRLIGTHSPLPEKKGSWVPLLDREEVVGAVVRTRRGTKPLYVSTGHRVSLATAVHYVLACCSRFRLPETTRWAHQLAAGKEFGLKK